jgi:hypothetical protein
MPTPKQQLRRALELLEASIDGCTEAIMLAYGFKTELLVELVNAELATATIEHMAVGGRRVKVILERGSASRHRLLACAMMAGPDDKQVEARGAVTHNGGAVTCNATSKTRAKKCTVRCT